MAPSSYNPLHRNDEKLHCVRYLGLQEHPGTETGPSGPQVPSPGAQPETSIIWPGEPGSQAALSTVVPGPHVEHRDLYAAVPVLILHVLFLL